MSSATLRLKLGRWAASGGSIQGEPVLLTIGARMLVLARALTQTLTFLSLSDDTTVQPDAAIQALEDVAHILQACSVDEIAALQAIVGEHQELLRTNNRSDRDKLVAHYDSLLTNLGLTARE